MKKYIVPILFSILFFSACAPKKTVFLSRTEATHMLDGIWMRDPYIVIGPDGDYYLTYTSGKTDMPVWKSTDLENWTRLEEGYRLEDLSYFSRATEENSEMIVTRGEPKLWAPEMYFLDGRWVVVHTSNYRQSTIIASESPTFDSFTEPMGIEFGAKHDPSLFRDDDGTIWLVCKCAELWEIEQDLSGFTGKVIKLHPADRKMGHEGCQILKIGDRYVWFGTAWSTDEMRKGTYNLYYATANKVEGPYGERRLAGRFLGHGTVFQDKDGEWWCTAFLNGTYVDPGEAMSGVDDSIASTINRQGLTLVPLDVKMVDGDVSIQAIDPHYK